MKGRRAAVVVAVLFSCAVAAFWQWRVIAPVRLPQPVGRWNQDLFTLYYPTHVVAYGGGDLLPAWNPHQLAGMPLVASYVCGLLYPPRFLSVILPPQLAIGWGTAFDMGLGGLFVLAAARRLRLGWAAALVAAVAFLLHVRVTLDWRRPSYFAGLMWIPAVLLATAEVVRRPSTRAGAVLGVALAFQLLTGHVQIVCYTVYGAAIAAVADLLQRRESAVRQLRPILAAMIVAGGTALALAAVQLLPTMELLQRATRSTITLARTEPERASLGLLRSVFIGGGPAVLLVPLALAARRCASLVLPALALAAFALLVGLGTPFYSRVFYAYVPGGNLFRWPQEIDSLSVLAFAMLAAVGLDAACTEAWSWRRRALAAAGILVLAFAAMPAGPMRAWAMALVVAALALLALPPSRWRAVVGGLIAALVVVERGLHPNPLMMPQNLPATFFAPPPFVDVLRERAPQERVFVVKNWRNRWPFSETMGNAFGLQVIQSYEPLAPEAYHAFLRPLGANVDEPLFWGRFHPPPSSPAWRLLDMLAVRHVVVPKEAAWAAAGLRRFRLVHEDRQARIYENVRALPRARLVGHWRRVRDAAAALAAVHDPGFDPRHDAVVEGPVPAPPAAGAGAPGTASITGAGSTRIDVEVEATRPALLILADLYWPGWRVAVDGVEQPLLRTDYLLRGVMLEPGVHQVRFWYVPWALRLGAVISGVTALTLLAAAASHRFRATSIDG